MARGPCADYGPTPERQPQGRGHTCSKAGCEYHASGSDGAVIHILGGAARSAPRRRCRWHLGPWRTQGCQRRQRAASQRNPRRAARRCADARRRARGLFGFGSRLRCAARSAAKHAVWDEWARPHRGVLRDEPRVADRGEWGGPHDRQARPRDVRRGSLSRAIAELDGSADLLVKDAEVCCAERDLIVRLQAVP